MRATLRFDMDDPDDRIAHHRCAKSLDMALCLAEIRSLLSKAWEEIEDNAPLETEEGSVTLAGFHRKLRETFDDYGIEPEELMR